MLTLTPNVSNVVDMISFTRGDIACALIAVFAVTAWICLILRYTPILIPLLPILALLKMMVVFVRFLAIVTKQSFIVTSGFANGLVMIQRYLYMLTGKSEENTLKTLTNTPADQSLEDTMSSEFAKIQAGMTQTSEEQDPAEFFARGGKRYIISSPQ